MKTRLCALLLALAMACSLTACRFTFELGGLEGGVYLELTQKSHEQMSACGGLGAGRPTEPTMV